MKETTRNTIVGITALSGLLALMWLIFIFGEVPTWTASNYQVLVRLDDAAGIAPGSRVALNGIDIGSVERVRFQENPAAGVEVVCQIEQRYPIPSGSVAYAQTSLLGGVGRLSIRATAPEAGPDAPDIDPLPKDGTGVLRGESISMTQQIRETTRSLSTDLRAQLKNFGRVSEKIIALADEYTAVGRRVNEMLEQRSLEAVEAGEVQANLTTLVARTDRTLAQTAAAAASINEMLDDPQLRKDIAQTIRNARLLSADARQLVGDAGEQVDELTRKYIAAADNLSQTITQLNGLLADARSGEGTLGRLVQDPALYNSLTDTAQRLSATLRQANLLLQKWKAEGLPVQF